MNYLGQGNTRSNWPIYVIIGIAVLTVSGLWLIGKIDKTPEPE